MEIRHLRYFIAAAEKKSVREAAETIHISQPALSRQIHDLEDELGTELFVRSAKGLELTPVGEMFLVRAQQIVSDANAAKDQAQRMAQGLSGRLVLGFVENATWDGRFPIVLRRFKELAPDVDLELYPLNSHEQFNRLDAGMLDGALLYPFGPVSEKLEAQALTSHNVVAAFPGSWSPRNQTSCSLQELAGWNFITFPRSVNPPYYDHLQRVCANHGVPLRSIQEADTESAILALVSSGLGAAIVNSANRYRQPRLVELVTLTDLSIPLELHFVYAKANLNPALKKLVNVLSDLWPQTEEMP